MGPYQKFFISKFSMQTSVVLIRVDLIWLETRTIELISRRKEMISKTIFYADQCFFLFELI